MEPQEKKSLPLFPTGKEHANISNSGVYAIVNKINGRTYYGSSSNLISRKKMHWSLLKNNKNSPYLQNDYNKYGKAAFEFVILEQTESSKEAVLNAEQKYLDMFYDQQNMCYNISPKANSRLGSKDTDATKNKKSKIFSGIGNPMYGRRHTTASKEAISKSNIGKKRLNNKRGSDHWWFGKKHDSSTKIAMSELAKLRWTNPEYRDKVEHSLGHVKQHGFLGKKHTEKTKKLMSEAKKGFRNPMFCKTIPKKRKMDVAMFFSKPVEQIDPKTKLVINIFSSMTEAARCLGINVSSISKVCTMGKYRKTAGGFSWRYSK